MEGLVLNEESEYVTYMAPIFETIGLDLIRDLNWRITYVETGGPLNEEYSFGDCLDYWISGDTLVDEVMKYPEIQWIWGLLQGFKPGINKVDICREELVVIQMDETIWTNPISMRSPQAEIEIEAFDSSLSIVIAKDDTILQRLQSVYRKSELLSEYNNSLNLEP